MILATWDLSTMPLFNSPKDNSTRLIYFWVSNLIPVTLLFYLPYPLGVLNYLTLKIQLDQNSPNKREKIALASFPPHFDDVNLCVVKLLFVEYYQLKVTFPSTAKNG